MKKYYYLTRSKIIFKGPVFYVIWEQDPEDKDCLILYKLLNGSWGVGILRPGFRGYKSTWQSDIIGESEDKDLLLGQAALLEL